MSPPAMLASLLGDTAATAAELDARLPDDWPEPHLRQVMLRRLQQMQDDPTSPEWLLRAMVHCDSHEAIGYINFHGPPGETGRAELGYTVFEPYRRHGYAREAIIAMMRWAHHRRDVSTFVVSISPANAPSLALAASLGFQRTGTQMDEIDGEEYVFELQWPAEG